MRKHIITHHHTSSQAHQTVWDTHHHRRIRAHPNHSRAVLRIHLVSRTHTHTHTHTHTLILFLQSQLYGHIAISEDCIGDWVASSLCRVWKAPLEVPCAAFYRCLLQVPCRGALSSRTVSETKNTPPAPSSPPNWDGGGQESDIEQLRLSGEDVERSENQDVDVERGENQDVDRLKLGSENLKFSSQNLAWRESAGR